MPTPTKPNGARAPLKPAKPTAVPQIAAPPDAPEPPEGTNYYAPRAFTPEEIAVIKDTIARGASDVELKLFLHYCAVGGFDPMRKQAYFSIQKVKCSTCYAKPENWAGHAWGPNACKGNCDHGYNRQVVFIPGIDGMMARAQRHPDFGGISHGVVHQNDDFEFDAIRGEPVRHTFGAKDRGPAVGAWATVYMKGKKPMAIWYLMAEYQKSAGFVGAGAPDLMLDKSCMCIALRRTLPDPFSAAYGAEEFGKVMEQAEDGTVILRPASAADVPVTQPVPQIEPGFAEPIEVPAQQAVIEMAPLLRPAAAAARPTADWDAPMSAEEEAASRESLKAQAARMADSRAQVDADLAAAGLGLPEPEQPPEPAEVQTDQTVNQADAERLAAAEAAAAAATAGDELTAEQKAARINTFFAEASALGWGGDLALIKASLKELGYKGISDANHDAALQSLKNMLSERRAAFIQKAREMGWRFPSTAEQKAAGVLGEANLELIQKVMTPANLSWPLTADQIGPALEYLTKEKARKVAAAAAKTAAAGTGARA